MTLVPCGDLPSLVGEIAGGPIKGSWWAHEAGDRIYACATALSESPETLTVKLIDGKVTFVHEALWPALYRMVSDRGWRAEASGKLGTEARRLLARVEADGEVRAPPAKPRGQLEASLLVCSEQVHTESGKHITVLRTWTSWATADLKRRAKELSLADAMATIESARGGAR